MSLFAQFEPKTKNDWQAKVIAELKGADVATLNSYFADGTPIAPMYFKEDATKVYTGIAHLLYPRANEPWEIRQNFKLHDQPQLNKAILQSLMSGASAIGIEGKFDNYEHFCAVLNGVKPEYISLYFNDINALEYLVNFINSEKPNLNGAIEIDHYEQWQKDPHSYNNEEMLAEDLAVILETAKVGLGYYRTMTISAPQCADYAPYEACAAALTKAKLHIDALIEMGYQIDEIAPFLQVNITLGNVYFMEIAKLRAMRLAWQQLINRYHPLHACTSLVKICCTTSNSYGNDKESDIVRASLQAMAAVIGGTDSLYIAPYAGQENFAQRIAVNTQLVLQHEASFGQVLDPSAGSYYIEHLTKVILEKALKIAHL